MKILIVGAGKLGYYLAKNLLESGHKVLIIEEKKAVCEKTADSLNIQVLRGDGTRIETLSQAKAASFDAFVAVTGRDQNNLIACEIAKKQFGIKKVVSRSKNPKNIQLMKKLGIDIAVNTTQIITDLIEHEIDGEAVKVIRNIRDSSAVICEYNLPDSWSLSGSTVSEIGIPEGCVLLYALRKGELLLLRGNTVLLSGDEVVALAVGNASKALKKLFEIR